MTYLPPLLPASKTHTQNQGFLSAKMLAAHTLQGTPNISGRRQQKG
jgi:hypothetical protein